MKYRYITIEREFGSAGTEIGRKVAETCKIAFYGREILEKVAEKFDTSVERIEQYEEKSKGSFLYSLAMFGRIGSGEGDLLTGEDYIYIEEQSVIQKLAQNGPAVFMGHCASKALEDEQKVLKVFIHANTGFRKERAETEYQIPKEQTEMVMQKFDKKRANYYSVNTSRKWNDLRNYDMVLDSSVLGVERCVDMIVSALEI